MHCTKCGWPVVYGPGGCACTQAVRREREQKEALEEAKRFAESVKMFVCTQCKWNGVRIENYKSPCEDCGAQVALVKKAHRLGLFDISRKKGDVDV